MLLTYPLTCSQVEFLVQSRGRRLLLKHRVLPLILCQFLLGQQVTASLYSCCSLPHSSSLSAGNITLTRIFGAAKMLKVVDPDAQVVPAVTWLHPETPPFLVLLVSPEHPPGSYALFLEQAQR